MKKEKSSKRIADSIPFLLLLGSVLPLLYIGRYNVLAADDYSMCKEMHHVIAEGGGIGDIVSYAFSYVVKSYQTWIGCYSVSFRVCSENDLPFSHRCSCWEASCFFCM